MRTAQIKSKRIDVAEMDLASVMAAINKKYHKEAVYLGASVCEKAPLTTKRNPARVKKVTLTPEALWKIAQKHSSLSWAKDRRYYQIYIQRSLFNEISITLAWGRVGSRLGNSKTLFVPTLKEANPLVLAIHKRRLQKRYNIVHCD